MRKLIVSMNITLDGFVAGPAAELDWHFPFWDESMGESMMGELSNAGSLLLGRVTYEALHETLGATAAPARADIPLLSKLADCPKMVFSSTLAGGAAGIIVLREDLQNEMQKQKAPEGKAILTYGSLRLVSLLSDLAMVDEFVLWLHPIMIGRGIPLFRPEQQKPALRLRESHRFPSGVIRSRYTSEWPAKCPSRSASRR